MAFLNEVIVEGTHHIKAEFCFDGKVKIWNNKKKEITQWATQVGGVDLPQMTQEELQELHANQHEKFEDKLQAHKNSLLASQELFQTECLAEDVKEFL